MTNLIMTAIDKALAQETSHISFYLGSLSQWVKHVTIIEYNEETIRYMFKLITRKTKAVRLIERISYLEDILHIEYTSGVYGEKETIVASFNQNYKKSEDYQESSSKLSSNEEELDEDESDNGQTS